MVVASLAISVAVVVVWVAAIIIAFGAQGVTGRARVLQFLSPGQVNPAVALVVAVLLVVLHRQREGGPPGERTDTATALLVAVIVAAAIGVASLVRGIVELTVVRRRTAVNIGHCTDALAAVPIAAAAVLWGLRARAQPEAEGDSLLSPLPAPVVEEEEPASPPDTARIYGPPPPSGPPPLP
jgi:hypothetical protein